MSESATHTLPSARPARAEKQAAGKDTGSRTLILLASVFVIANCGLIYELLAGTLSSYLLGSSVTQFSLVIGLFLSAMGLGAFLSRVVHRQLLRLFLAVEILIGLVGGVSALLLFSAFAVLDTYEPLLFGCCLLIGTLVGLEIPLLIRILRSQASLRAALGNVLALDYLGALSASLLFPLVLVPRLGLIRTSFLFGLMNVVVALIGIQAFRRQIAGARLLRLCALAVSGLLTIGLFTAGKTTTLIEDVLYDDQVIFAKTTPFQRLVLTRWRNDIRLYIDGNIQFSSVDEYRYHEALVHPAMGLAPQAENVLLLGGGDGLAAREALKYPTVKRIDLVDIDPQMTRLFAQKPMLVALNQGALKNPKVHVINQDAQLFLQQGHRRYDVIIIDLPDPNNESVGKLYTRSFYRLVGKSLKPTGVMVTQATSPYFATESFWCIVNTIRSTTLSSAGGRLSVLPYNADVPSFGNWGFVMASPQPLDPLRIQLKVPTRFLSPQMLRALFVFPRDSGPRPTPINRIDNQVLVQLYDRGYKHFNK